MSDTERPEEISVNSLLQWMNSCHNDYIVNDDNEADGEEDSKVDERLMIARLMQVSGDS
jgi:hypothetical protein